MYDVAIEPDPSRPLGGYAKVTLPAGAIEGMEVSLTVYEMFKERFLGQDGWQPTEAAFGPYPVRSTATQQEFVIGPEIVNHLSEFVPVRLGFGSFDAEVTWPDSVAVAPNAPPLGQVIGNTSEPPGPSTPVAKPEQTPMAPAPPPKPTPKPAPKPNVPVKPTGINDEGKSGKSWVGVTIGVLIAIALAIGAYLYWSSLTAEPEPMTGPADILDPVPDVESEPEPEIALERETVPAVDPCAAEVLVSSEDDFATRLGSLRRCAGEVNADTALRILESGVAAEDASALLLFGHLYNSAVTDEEIEHTMGLSFADNLEVAIEYYTRARDAGSDTASEALTQACESLLDFDPSAAEDVCE